MAHNPRLKVTLSTETFETIERLAELNGTSMSSIVGELIESVSPAMRSTLVMLEAAQDASSQTKQKLLTAMDSIERQAAGALGSTHAQIHHELHKAARADKPSNPAKKRPKSSKKRS